MDKLSQFTRVVALAAIFGTNATTHADILFSYSGYGANGSAFTQNFAGGSPQVPVAGNPYNTGNIDSSGAFGIVSNNIRPSFAFNPFATGERFYDLIIGGIGSDTVTGSGRLTTNLAGVSYDDNSNREINGGGYAYNAFSVSATAVYTITMNLTTAAWSENPNGGGYNYNGIGGGFNLEDKLNGAGSNVLWDVASTGNFGDPSANTTLATYMMDVTLSTGTYYQLNFNSYQYAGFGGPELDSLNSGWNYTITLQAVPEPTSAALLGVAGIMATLRRNRRKG